MASKEQKSSEPEPRVAPTKNAKPFRCNRCSNSKGFKTIGAKNRHAREEHGPKKYKCEYCGHSTKRRYQTTQHKEEAHPERQAFSTADLSSNQGSRGSMDSYSPDEAAAGHLQHALGPLIQQLSLAQKPLSVSNTSLNGSEAYMTSTAGISRHPVEHSYAANASAASYYDNNPIPLSVSRDQASSYAVQSPYSPMSTNVPFAQANGIPWGAPSGASQPAARNLPVSDPSTMGPPNQLEYPSPSSAPYYSGNSRGIHYNPPPYPSSSSEQGSPISRSTGSPYTGEAGQPNDWPQQPPTMPQ